MSELNRNQVIQALEYCTGIKSVDACANCPAYLGCNDCVDFLREESLALIKELIEENERLWKTGRHLAQIVVEAAIVDPVAKEMLEENNV